jgi:hypothetical protein
MQLLGGHDAKLTVYLYEGFTFGFPLHFEGLRISFYANYNLLSAEQNPAIVSTKWSKELAAACFAAVHIKKLDERDLPTLLPVFLRYLLKLYRYVMCSGR